MNICLVGYGMMGNWHSGVLRQLDCCLHTVVGRRPELAREFACQYGYQHWTTDLSQALANEDIDAVIVANPSEMHAETALACLEAGKHTLVEIPIAMSLHEAHRVVKVAEAKGRILEVCHPMRLRPEMVALRQRVLAGEEVVQSVTGRMMFYRLENVGQSGYRRSWVDNILWHHTAHTVDFALWMAGANLRRIQSTLSPLDPHTGTPTQALVAAETERNQLLVCFSSYYSREMIMDTMVISDRDSYRIDLVANTLTTGAGVQEIADEETTCCLVTRDFIDAVREGRETAVPGWSVLRTMEVLQVVQDRWDETYGPVSLPGRPLPDACPSAA